MKKRAVRLFTVLFAVLFLSLTVLEMQAHARAGGGRSFGSRGGSYSRQVSPAPSQSMPRQQYAPAPSPYQQRGGGFMSGLAGGMMGGMLGSMLFSGNAQAGGQAPAGGGIGLFEIIILAGGGYFIYRAMSRRRG